MCLSASRTPGLNRITSYNVCYTKLLRLKLPQSSVALKVTVAAPVAPHPSEMVSPVLDQVTDPQRSEATAPPLLFSQVENSVPFELPHSTVWLEAGMLIVGGVVSGKT